jgi:hypothetical protein
MTPDELVRDFLAKGGKVTVCPPEWAKSPTKSRPLNPWWVRSDWTLVKVAATQIDSAEAWLKDRGIRYYKNLTMVRGCWHVRVERAQDAVLFKLIWGGNI